MFYWGASRPENRGGRHGHDFPIAEQRETVKATVSVRITPDWAATLNAKRRPANPTYIRWMALLFFSQVKGRLRVRPLRSGTAAEARWKFRFFVVIGPSLSVPLPLVRPHYRTVCVALY